MTPKQLTVPPSAQEATRALQTALDCALDGPLHLTLAAGTHRTGGLRLHSHTVLELAEGATLAFLPDYDAYAQTQVAVQAEDSNRAMLTATGAEALRIIGKGRIACDGAARFSRGLDAEMGTRIPNALRPRVLVLDGCRDVEVSGIEIVDSPMWTLHFVNCADLRLTGLRIDNDRQMPNTDGIVIDGCADVAISGCEIRTADDGIVLKTSARIGGGTVAPCRNVRVTDCVIESRSCALKIGTESFADFEDIAFSGCRIEASNRALGIFSRDGGTVRGVTFEDIALDCHETPSGYWGSGEPVTITVLDRRPELRPAGEVADVTIRRLTGTAPGALNFHAERPGMIRNIALEDIALDQSPGPIGTALCYDLRPSPADLIPSDTDAGGRINAWRIGADGRVIGLCNYPGGLPAVFASGVAGLSLTRVAVTRPDPLPPHWSADPVTQERTG